MSNELTFWLPIALGFSVAVLVWAILCAIARSKKEKEKEVRGLKMFFTSEGCGKCMTCGGVRPTECVGFPRHGHAWCGCDGGLYGAARRSR